MLKNGRVGREIKLVATLNTPVYILNQQGGSEILESLGYTQYNGFNLQYPR